MLARRRDLRYRVDRSGDYTLEVEEGQDGGVIAAKRAGGSMVYFKGVVYFQDGSVKNRGPPERTEPRGRGWFRKKYAVKPATTPEKKTPSFHAFPRVVDHMVLWGGQFEGEQWGRVGGAGAATKEESWAVTTTILR